MTGSGKAPEWLPDTIGLADHAGDWGRLLDALHGVFRRDFVNSRPYFDGLPVVHDSRKERGKEQAFWHIIEGEDEAGGDRIPQSARWGRIAWVRPTIENRNDPVVSVWRSRRGKHDRVLLWLEDLEYLVVLEDRKKVMVLVTAYTTDRDHTKRKLRKDRGRALEKSKRRPNGGTA